MAIYICPFIWHSLYCRLILLPMYNVVKTSFIIIKKNKSYVEVTEVSINIFKIDKDVIPY